MFKIAIILLATMLVAVSYGAALPGGYTDRPDLIEDSSVKALASHVAEHLAVTQNLILDHLKVTRVQIQIVAGINYKLDFTAAPVNGIGGKIRTCHATIYVRFDSTQKITEAQCDAA